MPRDSAAADITAETDREGAESERLYRCALCNAEVTRGRWEMAMNGDHEHVVFNPAGMVFRILCFREAPGLSPIGRPDRAFTWFKPYAWRIGLCRSCGAHLGWLYEGQGDEGQGDERQGAPPVFFGLIKAALVVRSE